MSDETPPPPLRLKPRLRPESDSASTPPAAPEAAPPAAAAEIAAPAADAPAPKLRIKPKLSAPEAAPQQSTAPPPPPAAPPVALVSAAPASDVAAPAEPGAPPPASAVELSPTPEPSAENPAEPPPPAASSSDEPPRIKFKVKPRDPATGAPLTPLPRAAAAASSTDAAEKHNTPPPFPVVAPAGAPTKKFPPPPRIPHMRAPGAGDETAAPAKPAPTKPRRSIKKTLLIAASALVFVAAGVTYHTLTAPPPAPPPRPAVKKPAAGPTPSTTANQIAAAPGAAIDKAQNAVTSRRANEQGRLDALVAGEEPPDQRALATPPPSNLTAKTPAPAPAKPASVFAPVTSTSQLAPGITATTTTEVGGGTASPAFRSWVANVRISGVFQGTPPRALINGRTVRMGQVVDDVLGITFDGFDIDSKTIVFRDRTGSTVTRKF